MKEIASEVVFFVCAAVVACLFVFKFAECAREADRLIMECAKTKPLLECRCALRPGSDGCP